MDGSNDFAEFIRRIRSGDETAVRELIQQYEQELRIIARGRINNSRLRSLFDSSDVCQSILANFLARVAIGQFDLESPQDLLNLLATMVRNKIKDYTRGQNRQRRDSHRLYQQNIDDLDLAGTDETPSVFVANKEFLEKFFDHLTKEERQIADMRRDGQTWEQISAGLGEPSEALRRRFSRALDRVSSELGLSSLRD
ncbi:MAG: sigma-70 family RNA polymerase sigma factor [Schlesneria sp.]